MKTFCRESAQNLLPLRAGERAGVRCRFASLFFFFVYFACFVVTAPAAVFTTNLTLSETNFAYDGQDIVMDGATVAIDGPHALSGCFTKSSCRTSSSTLKR